MCHSTCLEFGQKNLLAPEIENKTIIELGSYYVNGSLRPYLESLKPAAYTGVDIQPGKCVDAVCDVHDIFSKFKPESFDVVISTEMLEHVEHWKKVISNIKKLCKPGGIILLTTRSKGFHLHSYPYDFWRYELTDFANMFKDLDVKVLVKDRKSPGVFLKAIKPINFKEIDLKPMKLYNIVQNKIV